MVLLSSVTTMQCPPLFAFSGTTYHIFTSSVLLVTKGVWGDEGLRSGATRPPGPVKSVRPQGTGVYLGGL